MRKVKELELIFENVTGSGKLSVGDGDNSDVGYLFISDIEKRVITVPPGLVEENYIFKTLCLRLNPSANRHFNEYGEGSKETLFERITNCGDIVDIILYFDDGEYKTSETYCAYWHEDDEEINRYQDAVVGDDGVLEIRLFVPEED